jgi:DNA-binding transcriptional LysR family regulator
LVSLSKDAREAVSRPSATAIVRLGVPEDFAVAGLTSLLSGFARNFPQIRLDTTSTWTGELRRLLSEGELDLSLIKRDANEGRCLARWPEQLAWVAGGDLDVAVAPIPLALFPQGCIYRRRAVETIEAMGRSWRVAYVGQGLAGVQAAVSSGIGISLLATDTIQEDHRRLGREDGFPDPPPTELALLAGNHRPRHAVSALIEYLRTNIRGAEK